MNCTRQAREKLSKSVEGTTTVELSIEDEKIEIEFSVGEVSKANQTMMDAGKLRYYSNKHHQFELGNSPNNN